MSDKKKYPWIKSIFHRRPKTPAECVYAGPEQMEQPVYAGPERRDPPPRKVIEAEMEDVYAGPGMMDRRLSDEPEEDAPVPEETVRTSDPLMMMVYAAPEGLTRFPVNARIPDEEKETRYCPECGTPYEEGEKICPGCGMALGEGKNA